MRRLKAGSLFILVVVLAAGCWLPEKRREPRLPKDVSGWVPYQERGLRIRGEFVLRKGQPTENENVAIELIDIEPPEILAEPGTFQSGARARLRFSRVRDRTVMCEPEVRERQSGNLPVSCRDELAGFGIAGLYVSAINIADQWIFVRLTG